MKALVRELETRCRMTSCLSSDISLNPACLQRPGRAAGAKPLQTPFGCWYLEAHLTAMQASGADDADEEYCTDCTSKKLRELLRSCPDLSESMQTLKSFGSCSKPLAELPGACSRPRLEDANPACMHAHTQHLQSRPVNHSIQISVQTDTSLDPATPQPRGHVKVQRSEGRWRIWQDQLEISKSVGCSVPMALWGLESRT